MTFLKKVLLVDYEPKLAARVRLALEATGAYVVREEHDARLAATAARWFQPDLVLFDLLTPRAEVDAAAKQLHHEFACRNTPVACISPNSTGHGAVSCGGVLSGYSFLATPTPIEEFVGYIGELLAAAA